MDIETAFAGMEQASAFGAGQFFKGEGDFTLTITSVKKTNGFKGLCFISEFRVDTSTSAEDPVGATRSFVVKINPQNRYAFGDIKNFVFAAALGLDPDKVPPFEISPEPHQEASAIVKASLDEDYAKKVGISADLLVGLQVRLTTFKKPTRPSPQNPQGGVFTIHKWVPTA